MRNNNLFIKCLLKNDRQTTFIAYTTEKYKLIARLRTYLKVKHIRGGHCRALGATFHTKPRLCDKGRNVYISYCLGLHHFAFYMREMVMQNSANTNRHTAEA